MHAIVPLASGIAGRGIVPRRLPERRLHQSVLRHPRFAPYRPPPMASGSPRAVSVRSKLIVNTILGVAFVAISAPQSTRIPAHEWLSLAFIVIFALHILFSWQWIVGVTSRLLSTLRGQVRINYLLDAVSYLAMVAVIVSGIIISESVFPALGFPRVRDRFWAVIHDRSSELLLILIGAHLAMHWDWIVASLRRLVRGDLARAVASERRGSWVRPVLTLTAVSLAVTAASVAIGRTSFADRFRTPPPGARRAQGERRDQGRSVAAVASGDSLAAQAATGAAATSEAGGDDQATDRKNHDGGARKGGDRPRRREGERNQLGWRQRYLRPAIKIATFMGVPFLLTLVVASITGRARPQGGRAAPTDPLLQHID